MQMHIYIAVKSIVMAIAFVTGFSLFFFKVNRLISLMQAVQGKMICKPDRLAYPVRDDIPVMLEDEAAVKKDGAAGAAPRVEVELLFNGPFFLACFFFPVAAFRGVEWLVAKLLPSGK